MTVPAPRPDEGDTGGSVTPPLPSFNTTYRREDGDVFGSDWAWATELDTFDYDEYPVELVEEKWERTAVRTFWHLPDTMYGCAWGAQVDAEEPCDEDAVAWWRHPDGSWLQVCETHRLNTTQYGPDGYDTPPASGRSDDRD